MHKNNLNASSDAQREHYLTIHCVTEVSGALPSVILISWRSRILFGSFSSNLHLVMIGFFQKACSSSILISLKNENNVHCYKKKYIIMTFLIVPTQVAKNVIH